MLLDNPACQSNVKDYDGGLNLGQIEPFEETIAVQNADEELLNVLYGFVIPDYKGVVAKFLTRLNDPQEVIAALEAHVSTLVGRVDEGILGEIQNALREGGLDRIPRVMALATESLPSNERLAPLVELLKTFFPEGVVVPSSSAPSEQQQQQQQSLPSAAVSLQPFRVSIIKRVITTYWQIERAFHGDVTAESLYANLQEFYKSDSELAACFRSHYNLQYKNSAFHWLLDRILQSPDFGHSLVKNPQFEAALKQLTIFSGPKYFTVVHVTRDLLLLGKSISPVILYQQMEGKLLQALASGEQESLLQDMILGRYASMDALPKFFHHARADVRSWAVEAYIRRIFQSYSLGEVEVVPSQNASIAMKWTFSRHVSCLFQNWTRR